MNAGILDTITGAFVDALRTGQGALNQYWLPLLLILATIAFYLQLGPMLASGGAGAGDAVGSVLLVSLKIGVFYWLLKNLADLANAALLTFLQWGVAPTGGGVSADTFLAPSKVLDVGFKIGAPIREFTNSFIHWAGVWNWPMLITYSIVVFWQVTDEPSSRHGGLLLGKQRGKEVFRPLPKLEALVGIEDQRLHQCLGLLTTRFPDGFEGGAAFCR